MRSAGGKHYWPLPDGVTGDAEFSKDGNFRYVLSRSWSDSPGKVAMFVGLNPSTASPTHDDPTVRKCWGWARAWGFDSMLMLNAFAYRATHLAQLQRVHDAVGVENDAHLVRRASSAALVVAAWGNGAGSRGTQVGELLRGVTSLHCLGFTQTGNPRHPRPLPNATEAIPWI